MSSGCGAIVDCVSEMMSQRALEGRVVLPFVGRVCEQVCTSRAWVGPTVANRATVQHGARATRRRFSVALRAVAASLLEET